MASVPPTRSAPEAETTAAFPYPIPPGFDAAMRHSIRGSLAVLDADPGFYRCMDDIPTYALGVLALYLHATDRLYHRGLQEAARDLFSAGRATAVLARMQSARLIIPRDDFRSGRQRRYAPEPAMIQAYRTCYRIELESLSLIDPKVGRLVQTYDDPAVFEDVVSFLARRHLASATLDQELIDPLGGIGAHSMGLMLAYALAEAAFQAGFDRPEGEVSVNITHLARRLGVSRTHARRLLKMLHDAGLTTLGDKAGVVILTPAFADGFALYFQGMFTTLMAAVEHRIS